MWIKQKVKNKAGEFELRPVWYEPVKQEVEITPITGGISVDFNTESDTLEFIENSTVPKKRGKKK